MDLELSDGLDVQALAKVYSEKKRGQVLGILKPSSAERIYDFLLNGTPWGLVYNEGETVHELDDAKLRTLSPEDMQKIYQDVFIRAQNDYQFLYYYYPILTSYKSGKNPDFFLHRVLEFLNSEPMLDFMRKLTGIPELIKADAQATLYKADTFLQRHSDQETKVGRRCAYVLNLTKAWVPGWGGYLQFFDDEGNVEEAYLPAFNTLNVLTVPKFHSVSYVPPFCPGFRFAITGWYRDQ